MIIVYIRISVNVSKFLCHSVSGMMSAANSHTVYSFVLCRGIAKAGMRKKRSKETDSLSLSADLSKNAFTDRPWMICTWVRFLVFFFL